MPFVNLIQEQRTGIKQQEKKARAFFFGFAGITSVSILAFGYLLLRTEQSNGEYQLLQRQFQKLEPIVKQIEHNDKQQQSMAPKLTTLEGAQDSTNRWSRILDHLSRNVPSGVWLTNLRCNASDPAKPVQVNVSGLSGNQDSVGDLILRLQGCPDLVNVMLKFTQEKLVESRKGVEFEISSDIAGTEEKKPIIEAKESA